MVEDAQDLSFTGSAEAGRAYDRAIGHLVRFQPEVAEAAEASVMSDPTCVMGQVVRAYLSLMSTDESGVTDARDALENVNSEAVALLPRERAHLDAAEHWVVGDVVGAGLILGDISVHFPRDLLALFVGQQIDLLTGNTVGLRDRIGQALGSWNPDHPHFGFMQGMYAFGLEECNLYGLSEEFAHRAVSANPDDVQGIHAMVHTYEMQGRISEGIRFMQDHKADWATGNFLNVHNSWHFALYLLEGDDISGALDIYDRVLHHDDSEDVALQLLDASALLWRLYLEGVATDDRWKVLAGAWSRIVCPGYHPFNDMHAVMAFVAAGDLGRARDLVAVLEGITEKGDRRTRGWYVTATVGLPVCRTLIHFGEGDYDQVLDHLLPIRPRLHEFGGSHAQRDVIERTLLESAIRAHRTDRARALVNQRLGLRESSTYAWSKLSEVLTSSGDQFGAAEAKTRARDLADTIRFGKVRTARTM